MWAAYLLVIASIILVYYGLFQLSKHLYKRNPLWLIAFLVLIAPFILVLMQATNLLELMWVVLLTPFYGIAVLTSLFTTWMVRYYCIAFALLGLLNHIFLRKKIDQIPPQSWRGYERYWRTNLKEHPQRGLERKLTRLKRRGTEVLGRAFKKHSSLVLTTLLIVVLATTMVNSTPSIKDPTYEEAIQFLMSDQTNQNRYLEESYTCTDFATDFRENALKSGYECGYTVIRFPDLSSHALNCFNTTDNGLIFIEPQTDEVVEIHVGIQYWTSKAGLPPKNYTIVGYYTDW